MKTCPPIVLNGTETVFSGPITLDHLSEAVNEIGESSYWLILGEESYHQLDTLLSRQPPFTPVPGAIEKHIEYRKSRHIHPQDSFLFSVDSHPEFKDEKKRN